MANTLFFRDIRKNLANVSIERTVFTDDSAYQEHGHDYYEIFFVADGSVVHRINRRSIHMPVGSMWLIRPGDVHSLRKSAYMGSASLFNIAFDESLYRTLCICSPLELQESVLLSAVEQQLLRQQISIVRQSDQSDAEVVRSISWAVIMTAFSIQLMRNHRPKASPPLWLERCMADAGNPECFIAGLHHFIALSGVSQEHLTREMRRYYDLTPSRYINQLRLEYACTLLKNTSASLASIALKSGFNSISYFNRLFRQIYGCSPNVYRQQMDPVDPE